LAIGDVVDGKYRVERVVGRGGMGMVVAATHARLGTTVALKFLRTKMVEQPSVTERFLREARATAALKSEHVCHVFDVGTHDGTPYIVMELLDGIDLSRLLKEAGPLPVDEACHYLVQACAGLAEAHAARIIHRDLKPANLLLTTRTDGTALIKVLDFGIAKASTETDHELTQSSSVLGSPAYMSLEQLRSSKLVDERSDLWSLGITLFQLVTGTRPYAGDGPADLALKIALSPTPRLPPALGALDHVVSRCLQKEPADRFQTVAELASALAPFAANRGSMPSIVNLRSRADLAPTTPIDIPTIVPTTLQSGAGAVAMPTATPRSNRWLIAGVAAAIALGGGLGLIVAGSSSDETSSIPAATPEPKTTLEVVTPATPDAAIAATPDAAIAATPDAAIATPDAAEAIPDAGETAVAASPAPAKPASKPTKRKPAATKPTSRPDAPKPADPPPDFRRSRI
jgi:serine/threonine-protein kinase